MPGYPHHVTQRGNRRQRTFFGGADYRVYLALMAITTSSSMSVNPLLWFIILPKISRIRAQSRRVDNTPLAGENQDKCLKRVLCPDSEVLPALIFGYNSGTIFGNLGNAETISRKSLAGNRSKQGNRQGDQYCLG